MGVFEHFPYTNYHELNLDWVVEEVKRCIAKIDDIDGEIDAKVTAVLTEWLNDGTIADLINVTIFSDLSDRVTACEAKLAAIADTPQILNEVKAAPFIYDDSVTNDSQGLTADSASGYIYSWESGTFPNGTIHVYDSATFTEVQTFNNVAGYHGNDLEKIGNLIYIAQCYATANVLDGNNLLAFNVSNQSMVNVRTFPSSAILTVASIDDDTLIVMATGSVATPDIRDYTFYKYTISENSVEVLQLIDGDKCPLFGASQGSYFDRVHNVFYLLVSGPDSVFAFEYKNGVLTYKTCTQLSKYDLNGVNVGEFEGIASLNGTDLLLSSIVLSMAGVSSYSLNIGLVNLFNGFPAFPLPNNWHKPLNNEDFCVCDASATNLYEDGTGTYPFKHIGRAISACRYSGRFRGITLKAGNYGPLYAYDRDIFIDLDGNVTFTSMDLTSCKLTIIGTSSKTITITGTAVFRNGTHARMNFVTVQNRIVVQESEVDLRNLTTTHTASYPITLTASSAKIQYATGGASFYSGYAIYLESFSTAYINQVITNAQVLKPGTNWSLIRSGTALG